MSVEDELPPFVTCTWHDLVTADKPRMARLPKIAKMRGGWGDAEDLAGWSRYTSYRWGDRPGVMAASAFSCV